MAATKVSYSAVHSCRNCEQQYFYRYVDKLQPRVGAAPLELGTLIHGYFEVFYGAKAVDTAELIKKAHKRAMKKLDRKSDEISKLAQVTADLG